MSVARNGAVICDECGRFCRPYDESTQFGCKDYENPEPLDPSHYCKRCYRDEYRRWLKRFKEGWRLGDWQKSKAEIRAAKKCGLTWIHGMLGDYPSGNRERYATYEYVTPEKYAHIKALDEDRNLP